MYKLLVSRLIRAHGGKGGLEPLRTQPTSKIPTFACRPEPGELEVTFTLHRHAVGIALMIVTKEMAHLVGLRVPRDFAEETMLYSQVATVASCSSQR